MRVLTLIDAFRMGGAETLLAPLATAARDAGIEMDFIGLSPESTSSAETLTVLERANVRPRHLGVRRLLDPTALPRLVQEIRRSRCDVVHAHLEMAMTLGVPAAALTGRRTVCTFQTVVRDELTGRAAKRERLAVEMASRSHRVVFTSEASRESFRRAYRPSRMPANWTVVYNCIDIADYAPGEADPVVRSELGGATGPLVVLPATLREDKGVALAIEAWPSVLDRCPDAVLALVGGGELEPQLRALVAARGLSRSVLFAGIRTDMPSVYRAADLVLVPSIHENLATVLMEAAATERAVVASRVGGIPEGVRDGQTAILFDRGDVEALANAVVTLLRDTDRRGRMAEAGRHWVHQQFSAQAWIHHLREVYESATATPQRGRTHRA